MRVADSGGVPTILTSRTTTPAKRVTAGRLSCPAVGRTHDCVDGRRDVVQRGARGDVQLARAANKAVDGGSSRGICQPGILSSPAPEHYSPHRSICPRSAISGPPLSVLAPLLTEPAYGHAHFDISETGTLVYVGSGERRHNRTFLWVDTVATGRRRLFRGVRLSTAASRRTDSGAAASRGPRPKSGRTISSHDKSTRLAYGWDNGNPVWTPDSQRILFASTRGPSRTNNIYWQASDGTGRAERWTATMTKTCCHALCRGWKGAAVHPARRRTEVADPFVFVRRPFGGPLPDSPRIAQQRPALSPDGRWVAYHSNQSGRDEVYVQAYPEGGAADGRSLRRR